jgi:type I restriction-modification system DNA methylase subunit
MSKKPIVVAGREQQEFIKLLNSMAYNYHSYDVFCDFLTLGAIAFSNAIIKNEKLEKMYLDTISKYKKDVQEKFPELLALVTLGLEHKYCDFLGEVYMGANFGNSHIGQFFTPYSVCQAMADVNLPLSFEDKIYTICDPTCGAGALLVACCETMYNRHFNFQKNAYIEGTDISWAACCMSMIQLSIIGVPAKIYHGNSLSLECWNVMKTPMCYVNFVEERLKIQKENTEIKKEVKSKLEIKKEKNYIKNKPLFDFNFKK